MASRVRRYGLAHVIGAVLVVSVAAALLAISFAHDRAANIGTAKAWDIKGPPCPAYSQADFSAKRYTANKTFDYDGDTIGRAAGDASCSDVKDSGGKGFRADKVCQFTSPVAITVRTKAETAYFIPEAGHPATVIIHRDAVRCVLASDFTLKTE